MRSWVLLEAPGPWGEQALLDSRLPHDVGSRLDRAATSSGVRALLIRRHGRGATSTRPNCFLAHTGPTEGWIEHVRLPSYDAVLDLDLDALAHGRSPGLTRHTAPLFLVCTHGRHDPCCAERGRPIARVLAERFPSATWECSHLGGDRFAGNLLCFPDGLYFGRVGPEKAVAVAEEYAHGRIDLDHYRGRSSYPFPVQAAESYLRAALDIRGVGDLRLVSSQRRDDEVAARFAERSGQSYAVRVRTDRTAPRRLSCHDLGFTRAPVYALLDIAREFPAATGA